MDLSGFDAPGFTAHMGGAATATAAPPAPAQGNQPNGLLGLVKNIVSAPIRAGSDVVNTIGNGEVRLGEALGFHPTTGEETNTQQFGSVPVLGSMVHNDTPGEFAGNVAQTASYAMPGAEDAGLIGRVANGVRTGFVGGAGGAMAAGKNALGVLGGGLEGGGIGGAIGGALSPLLNLAGKVTGIGGAASAADEGATPTIGQKLSDALVSKGEQGEAKYNGYFPGQKVNGAQLSTAASKKIGQTLEDEGINALSAPGKLEQVGNKLDQYNTTRSSLMDIHNTPLTPEDQTLLKEQFMSTLRNEAGGTAPAVQNHAATFLSELGDKTDVASLAKYKTSLDNNAINWAANPNSVEPGQQLAAKTLRGVIKNFVEQKVPGLAELNQKATSLQTAQAALKNASGREAAVANGGEGLWGRLFGSEAVRGAETLASRGIKAAGEGIGNLAGTAENAGSKVESAAGNAATRVSDLAAGGASKIANTVKTLAGRAVTNGLTTGLQQPGTPGNATPSVGIDQLFQGEQPGTSAGTSPQASVYPQENMLYDIERDPTHAATYEALYKVMNPAGTAAAQNALLNAQNTGSQIAAYKTLLETAGGGQGGIGGAIQNFLGATKLVNNPQTAAVATAEQARNDLGAQIAKLVTGGSKPAESVIEHYTNLVPTVTDPPATVQAKLAYLNSIVSNAETNAQNSTTSANSSIDLSTLEAALGGG